MLDIKNFWAIQFRITLIALMFFLVIPLVPMFYLHQEYFKDKFLLIVLSTVYGFSIGILLFFIMKIRFTKVYYFDHYVLAEFKFYRFKKNKKIEIADILQIVINKANKNYQYKSDVNFVDPISVVIHYKEGGDTLKKIVNLGLIPKKDLNIFLGERHLNHIKIVDLNADRE